LKIKERLSWHTWQLITAAVGMLVFGMFIGSLFGGGGSSSASTSSNTPGYKLPPASSPSGGTSPSGLAGSSETTTTTTAPAGSASTSTSAPSSPTTTAAPATGTVSVLLGPEQSQGAWTSAPFTITSGQWNIGWAYRCTPAPASGPAFQVFVVPAGGSPGSKPAVSETGASGQSVTSQTSTGSQELMVQAPNSCIWAVKVTGLR